MKLEDMSPPAVEEMLGGSGVAKVAAHNWENYCVKCRRRYDMVSEKLRDVYPGELAGARVLDWGCATGGVAIILDDELPVEMHAADVDAHSIKWLTKVAPAIHSHVLGVNEPLPFGTAEFDVVFGVSVFTHLPPTIVPFYVHELRRITRDSGLVLLTVQSNHACDVNLRTQKDPEMHPNDRDVLREKGILYNSYNEKVLSTLDFATESSYGLTYISPQYIHKTFGECFEIVSIEEGRLGKQDLLTMKPS